MHFLVPGLLAWLLFRPVWKGAWMIMLASMLVDADHLLSTPIFSAGRCSIGFHPLHTGWAMLVYGIMLLVPRPWVRMLAVGLLFHMLTDFIDCLWMFSKCAGCCQHSSVQWVCGFFR
ncbi:hypothetical protein ADICEAN_01426 [Cesiribacter andamanensis AMV16]|uniref:Metal-dependent hydrolase n=2 Tax=Cesiribacter TaxID=1133570 RepID=M7NYE3_9BACT|nr:hypothetical protein ADICEAN_01426 [Cesiribacter andamanensis AMV16]